MVPSVLLGYGSLEEMSVEFCYRYRRHLSGHQHPCSFWQVVNYSDVSLYCVICLKCVVEKRLQYRLFSQWFLADMDS